MVPVCPPEHSQASSLVCPISSEASFGMTPKRSQDVSAMAPGVCSSPVGSRMGPRSAPPASSSMRSAAPDAALSAKVTSAVVGCIAKPPGRSRPGRGKVSGVRLSARLEKKRGVKPGRLSLSSQESLHPSAFVVPRSKPRSRGTGDGVPAKYPLVGPGKNRRTSKETLAQAEKHADIPKFPLFQMDELMKEVNRLLVDGSVGRIMGTWCVLQHADQQALSAEEIMLGSDNIPGDMARGCTSSEEDSADGQIERQYELIVLDGPWEHDSCEGLSMEECGFGSEKLDILCSRLSRLLTEQGTMLLFCSSARHNVEWREALVENGFQVSLRPLVVLFAPRCTLVRKKDGVELSKAVYMLYVVTREGAQSTTRNIEYQGFDCIAENRFPAGSQIIEGYETPTCKARLRGPGGVTFDIAEKTVSLCLELILRYTHQLDSVLDLFAGSGVFAEACIKSMRFFVGCEVDKAVHSAGSLRLERVVRRLIFAGVLSDPMHPGVAPRGGEVSDQQWWEVARYLEEHQRIVVVPEDEDGEYDIDEEQAREWRDIEAFSRTVVEKWWTGPERGWGLFALRRLPVGTFFGCYGGVIVSRPGLKETAAKRCKTTMELDRRIGLTALAEYGRMQHLNPEIVGSATGLMGFMNCARGPGNDDEYVQCNTVFQPCLWSPKLRGDFLRLVAQGNARKAWGYPYMMSCFTCEVIEEGEEIMPDYGVDYWVVPIAGDVHDVELAEMV